VRGREGYLRAQFLRLKPRRGPMKAIVAVAASILTAAYYMLRDGDDYHDLGAAHFQLGDHAPRRRSHPPSAPPRLRGHPPPRRTRSWAVRVTW